MKSKTKKIIIICALLLAGLVIGMLGYQDSFLTSLSDTSPIPVQSSMQILPASPILGEFTATYDRLGTVKLQVSTGGRINTNSIVFRLREKGTPAWSVENTYVTDRFIDGAMYPFGFPVIPDSKGRTYEYELTAISGSSENTIALTPGAHALQTDYSYPKALIVQNKQTALFFLKEKIKELFGTLPHLGYWIMCLLPVLFITPAYVVASLSMVVLFGFLPVQIHSNIVLWIGFSILWCSFYKKNYTLPFFLAAFILICSSVSYLCHDYAAASKFATIIPMLFLAGGVITYVRLKH